MTTRHIGNRLTKRYFPGGDAHLEHPDDGDFLQNPDTGSTWLVLKARPSPGVVGCWICAVERLDQWAVQMAADGVWSCVPIARAAPAPQVSPEAAQAWPPAAE